MIRNNWRIATNFANLNAGHFAYWKLPVPSMVTTRDHSVRASQGDGGVARHGFRNVSLLWNALSHSQGHTLRELVGSASSGILYATVYWTDGQSRWVNLEGKADLSDLVPAPPFAGASGIIYENVTLSLNAVTIYSAAPTGLI
jgi:hypothetical protein